MENDECNGIIAQDKDGNEFEIHTEISIWASVESVTYKHSTNFPHLTGDALTILKNTESVWSILTMYRFIDNIVFQETRKTLSYSESVREKCGSS